MKSYYDLLKNNIIDFDKLMLEKYYLLGLSETDTIILIKLNNLLKHGEQSLSLNSVVPFMSIDEKECSERIVKLVQSGFIALEMTTVKSKETFNLDETYKKLSLILSGEDNAKENDEKKELLKQTISLLEKELKKILSPIEKEIVNKWFYEYQYDFSDIDEAILDALKYKNRGIQYIDRSLFKKHTKKEEVKENSEIQDLFNQVYAKRK